MAKNKSYSSLFLLLALFFLLLIQCAHGSSWNKFCSVYCTSQNCISNASNACTANNCRTPWSWNTTTNKCELYNSSGWLLQDTSSDISGGNLLCSVLNTGTCPGPGGQWSYSFIGNQTGNQPISFNDTSGI